MGLFQRKPRGTRLFFATDVHGSEQCFRKWLNAARVYEADVLILGGDITGKALVPLVRSNGSWTGELFGKTVHATGEAELSALQHRIRMSGSYDLLLSETEKRVLDEDPNAVDEVFHRVVRESIERWVALADERLGAADVPGFVILGNDDFPELADALRKATHLRYADEEVCELPGGLEKMSFGYSTPTPWKTPRELHEDEMERRLDALARHLQEPEHAVFNVHCPPYGTHLDQAPRLDAEMRMIASAGGVEMISVGSSAVRSIIERYGPMLALHGHVHDSPGVQEIGRALCINPGSAYGEGVVRGAFVEVSKAHGIHRWQMVEA
jgi:Icc-related predicted phosphoesterase